MAPKFLSGWKKNLLLTYSTANKKNAPFSFDFVKIKPYTTSKGADINQLFYVSSDESLFSKLIKLEVKLHSKRSV